MSAFGSMMQQMRMQGFLSLYVPYLIVFVLIGGATYRALGRVQRFESMERPYSALIKPVIAVIVASPLSRVVPEILRAAIPV